MKDIAIFSFVCIVLLRTNLRQTRTVRCSGFVQLILPYARNLLLILKKKKENIKYVLENNFYMRFYLRCAEKH